MCSDACLYAQHTNTMHTRFKVFEGFIKDWTRANWSTEISSMELLHNAFTFDGLKLADWLLMPEVQRVLDVSGEVPLQARDIADCLRSLKLSARHLVTNMPVPETPTTHMNAAHSTASLFQLNRGIEVTR